MDFILEMQIQDAFMDDREKALEAVVFHRGFGGGSKKAIKRAIECCCGVAKVEIFEPYNTDQVDFLVKGGDYKEICDAAYLAHAMGAKYEIVHTPRNF